jgi:hypothetical protein
MKTNNIEEILEALEQNKIIKILCTDGVYVFKKESNLTITFKKSEISQMLLFGEPFSTLLMNEIHEDKEDKNIIIEKGEYFVYSNVLNIVNNVSLQDLKLNYLVNCECEILN